jgi:hypothetical protein
MRLNRSSLQVTDTIVMTEKKLEVESSGHGCLAEHGTRCPKSERFAAFSGVKGACGVAIRLYRKQL